MFLEHGDVFVLVPGLHDAVNTAKLAWRMVRDGCVMRLTRPAPANPRPAAVSRYFSQTAARFRKLET